jgi:hypothetical protein
MNPETTREHHKRDLARRASRRFRATRSYIKFAIELEHRIGFFDFALYSTCRAYRDAIFANAKFRAVMT